MEKITDVKRFGQIIKRSRKSQNLTQVQLAATCGVGVRFIAELEHGKESCQLGKAIQVMSMLGIDLQVEGESK